MALGWPALLVLGACGKKDEAAWALQHATLEVGAEGVTGYQVWEFYSRRWEKERDAKFHVCARVQAVSGPAVEPLAECADCETVFQVRAEEVETDCEGELATRAGFAAMTHFAFGPLPGDLDGDDPYPGWSNGWYQSWDGESLDLMGYAWNELLDLGEDPQVVGWVEGERFVLWPAQAWEL